MKKHNQIGSPWLWIIVAGVLVVLLVTLVTVALVLDLRPEDPGGEDSTTIRRATSADLYCLEFSRYSGSFVEDGSNEPVTGVAAALIENRSREFLDLATVTYDVGGKTAEFVVTGLPPGGRAWVLESNRMTVGYEVQFEFLECTSSFRQDAVLHTESLELYSVNNTLTVRNDCDRTLENVCVYYKEVNDDGAYLGGITYMMTFGTLEPGQSVDNESAHFSENSRIVRYSYQSG